MFIAALFIIAKRQQYVHQWINKPIKYSKPILWNIIQLQKGMKH